MKTPQQQLSNILDFAKTDRLNISDVCWMAGRIKLYEKALSEIRELHKAGISDEFFIANDALGDNPPKRR